MAIRERIPANFPGKFPPRGVYIFVEWKIRCYAFIGKLTFDLSENLLNLLNSFNLFPSLFDTTPSFLFLSDLASPIYSPPISEVRLESNFYVSIIFREMEFCNNEGIEIS